MVRSHRVEGVVCNGHAQGKASQRRGCLRRREGGASGLGMGHWGWHLSWGGGAADTLGQGRVPTEKALELEPMVVTATVAPTPLGRTTAPVTVISREQIAAQQATSVTELLRQSPGVHIDQAGARGGISSVYVRGSDPNFTVVLIDGIKVNDPTK
jgi:TonB-dependent Receptor Plug Domain